MKLISYLLIFQFVLFVPYSGAQTVTTTKKIVPFALVKMLRHELQTNTQKYFTKEELSMRDAQIDKEVTSEVVSEILKQLKDSSYSMNNIKEKINKSLIIEEQDKLIELKYLLSLAPTQKLDSFFKQAMKDGMYSDEYPLLYQSAFNKLEKIEVLMQMLSNDFSLIRSQNAKQLGMMNREQLITHFETTGQLSQVKGKALQTVIIVLAIAAAGLITWGIISATKKRHERKKAELNADYDQQELDAYNQHLQDIQNLEDTFAERERLREEGYVWQVCAVETTPKTSSCSYDYNSYSGNEVCTTRCLRNPQGLEAFHSTSCTSAFIPTNCFTKNPTAAGYDDGYEDGYDDGYDYGYDTAYDSAYNDAYHSAYSNAYSSGYSRGYNAGFDAGWDDGYDANSTSDKKMSFIKKETDDHEQGFQKGYAEGYSYALQLKTGL